MTTGCLVCFRDNSESFYIFKILKNMFCCRVMDLIGVYKKLSKTINYKNNIRLNLTYGIYYKFNSRLIFKAKIIIFF